jgi:parallel beta-helix repeat protein
MADFISAYTGTQIDDAIGGSLNLAYASNFATLASADTYASANNRTLIIAEEWSSVPATLNANIEVKTGGKIANSTALTINGTFASNTYCFNGAGTVSFGNGVSTISPVWFYDNGGNWGPAITKSIASATNLQRVQLPAGILPISGSGTELILMQNMVELVGHGLNATQLQVDSAVGATVDVIHVSPRMDGGGGGEGLRIADFTIAVESGTPARHGIYLDTLDSAQVINNALIERVRINQLGGHAIYTNQHSTNIDGFFSSTIQNCFLYGGIYLDKAGDTLRIKDNVITGAGWGVYANLVYDPYRANVFNVTGNVITSVTGGVYLSNCGTCTIASNQFEQQAISDGSDHAQVVVKGTDVTLSGISIYGNRFNLFPADTVATGLLIDNAVATSVHDNDFGLGVPTHCAIKISANAVDTVIGNNFLDAGSTTYSWRVALRNTTYIQNSGRATVGVYTPLTLQNGWSTTGSFGAPACEKTSWDELSISGNITGGTKTDGTVIFTLPVGFRPNAIINIPTMKFSSTLFNGICYLLIGTNGEVSIYGVDANTTQLSLDNINLRMFYN